MTVADAHTTVFTLDAAGLSRTISAYALGMGVGPDGPDADAYKRFEQVALLLSTFENAASEGQVLTADVYQPSRYRAVLSETGPDQPGVVDWPWEDVGLDDFQPWPDDPSVRLAGLTPDQVARVVATVPTGGSYGIPLRAPDGMTYDLMLRPLMPDETVEPLPFAG